MAEDVAPVIRATFELEPAGSAAALVLRQTTGVPGGPDWVQGRVVSDEGGRAVVELPAGNYGADVAMLLTAVVAAEATEVAAFTRCRLVGLDLPDGMLPGPAFAAPDRVLVGAVVQPSLGLEPGQVAAVAAAAAGGGADLVKDDELLADPSWCPLESRVPAVMDAIGSDIVYCPNVTGPIGSLLHRAERAVELGATGLMVNAFAMGLDAVRLLRDADLGVPLLAHRVGSGPLTRNDRFGVAPDVVAGLTRLCGSDGVLVGGFGPDRALFDDDDQVRASVAACRRPLSGVPPSVAILSGGGGPGDARAQADAAGGSGVMVLLGAAAYRHPGGIEEAVRATVEALA